MTHRENDFTLIFGKKHCGKSHLARGLVADCQRRIIIDPMREYSDGVIVRSFADAHAYLGRVKDGEKFSVILRTMNEDDELRTVALCVHGEPDRPLLPNTTLYIDEIDRLCSGNSLPPSMKRLANYGRHFGVSLIGVARSPKRVHGDFRRGADVMYVGKLNEPADVDYLNEYIGGDLCDRARSLQEREFIRWGAADDAQPTPEPAKKPPEMSDNPPGDPEP